MTDVIEDILAANRNGANGAVDDLTEKIQRLLDKATQKNGYDRNLNKESKFFKPLLCRFGTVIELRVVSAGDGKMVAELVIQPEHTNLYGTLHGGCTATIIDICTSIAMGTHSKPGNGVSVDLNISYLNPGKLNDTIVIEANTMKVGRTLGFAEATIKSKTSGAIIAKGSHTKHVENSDKYSIGIHDNNDCSTKN